MKRKIRMIGIDLDGTLLTGKKELTETSRQALCRAIQAGIVVVPVTGRPFSGVPAEIMDIPGIRYIITSNGANTYDREEGRVLRKEHLDHSLTRTVLDTAQGSGIIREIFIKGVGFHDAPTQKLLEERFKEAPAILAYINRSRKIVPDFEALLSDESAHVENISLMFPSQEERDESLNRILQIMGEGKMPILHVILPWRTDLEITHICADKWLALQDLAGRIGIDAREIMTLGDGDNDRPMLRAAGYSVAMGNAPDFVKKEADSCTLDNEHDGAAAAICRILQ